jgi:hypothetical protein
MIRKNETTIGELMREFFEENPELYRRIQENRVVEGWRTMLGPSISSATTNIYVKDRTLYVSLSSSVIRSELIMCKDHLLKSLNKEAKGDVIDNIVIR